MSLEQTLLAAQALMANRDMRKHGACGEASENAEAAMLSVLATETETLPPLSFISRSPKNWRRIGGAPQT